MTSLIIDLQNMDNIENFLVDGFIINIEHFSTFNGVKFPLEKIKELSSLIKKNKKKVLINIDRLYGEEDLNNLYQVFAVLKDVIYDYIIFSDFAVYYYFNKINQLNKLIYDAKTMGTNQDDFNFYKEKKIKVFVSNELTQKQIKSLSETNNACMEVFGFHQIFYSKRPILSLFKEYDQIQEPLKNTLLEIKEMNRDSYYKIYESDLGVFVYTDYIYCAYIEISDFVRNFEFIKINSIFLNLEKMPLIISYYRKLLNNENIIFNNQLIKEVYPNIKSGFLLQKSVLLKEALNEEN